MIYKKYQDFVAQIELSRPRPRPSLAAKYCVDLHNIYVLQQAKNLLDYYLYCYNSPEGGLLMEEDAFEELLSEGCSIIGTKKHNEIAHHLKGFSRLFK